MICDKDNINDFIQCFKDIYRTSIPLTSGNAENDRDTFFYSDVNIEDGNFVTIIYHKVDNSLKVVSFPFITSNLTERVTFISFFSLSISHLI